MGIIVKVYIENNDEEIDIVTLNSEDKKSSSVTITASVIKDYLNKLGRNEDVPVRRSDRIAAKKSNYENDDNHNYEDERSYGNSLIRSLEENDSCYLNSNIVQSKNVTCNYSGIHEVFTPATSATFSENIAENSNDHEVISQNSSNVQLNDIQDYIREIDDTNESGNRDRDNVLATTASCNTPGKIVNNQIPPSVDVEDTTLSMCVDEDPSHNPNMEFSTLDTDDARCQITVTQSDETVCDSRANNVENRLKNVESSFSHEKKVEIETAPENVIASLKNVSYEVDDFLDIVNITPSRHNQNINNLRLCGAPSFLDECNYSPGMYPEEIEDNDELEEYFVIEKIAASRLNEETKVLEFLLEAQKCVARKDPWAPTRTNITDLTISDPKCLFIRYPKGFRSYRKRLHEKFDQYAQLVDMESLPSCPSVIDSTTHEFSSVVSADAVVDLQKSLNDVCLIEAFEDKNKNISPIKMPKNGQNINNMTDIGLPSAHFYIADMVPGLGDQLVEFVENNPTPSTNATNETEICRTPVKNLSSDRPRKKNRNDHKHLQCSQCSYKTISTTALGNHLRRHTNELLTCESCPKRFLSSAGLKNHQKIHQNGEITIAEVPIAKLPIAERSGAVVSDCFGKTVQNQFLESLKFRVKSQLSPGGNSFVHTKHSQSSVPSNAAAGPNRNLFSNSHVACKMKHSAKKQLKNPKGRSKRVKTELKHEPVNLGTINLCDDVSPSECSVPRNILTNATPSKSEILQECLANTIHVIESNNLRGLAVETSTVFPKFVQQESKETQCDVCQQPLQTAVDLYNHKEKFHKYPIVLLKRLSISY